MFVVEKNNSIMFTLIDERRETRDERVVGSRKWLVASG